MEIEKDEYVNRVIHFVNGSGCIPKNSFCYCYRKESVYYWVHFKEPVLGRTEIKLHENVIFEHGKVVRQ